MSSLTLTKTPANPAELRAPRRIVEPTTTTTAEEVADLTRDYAGLDFPGQILRAYGSTMTLREVAFLTSTTVKFDAAELDGELFARADGLYWTVDALGALGF